jgi:hypothetical protein
MDEPKSDLRFLIGAATLAKYRDCQGGVGVRHILPLEVYWLAGPGWMLRAYDYERAAPRDFVLDGFLPGDDGRTREMPGPPPRDHMIAIVDDETA